MKNVAFKQAIPLGVAAWAGLCLMAAFSSGCGCWYFCCCSHCFHSADIIGFVLRSEATWMVLHVVNCPISLEVISAKNSPRGRLCACRCVAKVNVTEALPSAPATAAEAAGGDERARGRTRCTRTCVHIDTLMHRDVQVHAYACLHLYKITNMRARANVYSSADAYESKNCYALHKKKKRKRKNELVYAFLFTNLYILSFSSLPLSHLFIYLLIWLSCLKKIMENIR